MGKSCHGVSQGMENPSRACPGHQTPPLGPELSLGLGGEAGEPVCECLLRAARFEASSQRGHDCRPSVPYQTWDLARQQEGSSILQQLLLILHLLFAGLRKANTWERKRENTSAQRGNESQMEVYNNRRYKVVILLPWD